MYSSHILKLLIKCISRVVYTLFTDSLAYINLNNDYFSFSIAELKLVFLLQRNFKVEYICPKRFRGHPQH